MRLWVYVSLCTVAAACTFTAPAPLQVPDNVETEPIFGIHDEPSASSETIAPESMDAPQIQEEYPNSMDTTQQHTPFSEERARVGWHDRVGDDFGLWVSVHEQALYVFHNGQEIWRIPCATAAEGMGSRINSYQTPPGWHRVSRKIGDGEPIGRVFRARAATAEIWHPDHETKEDLVLTRIFILDGLEPGVNQGKDAEGHVVDSRQRYIYIHGTNDEARLGEPSSKGCIRVSNNDAIDLYDMIPTGTLLYISADDTVSGP